MLDRQNCLEVTAQADTKFRTCNWVLWLKRTRSHTIARACAIIHNIMSPSAKLTSNGSGKKELLWPAMLRRISKVGTCPSQETDATMQQPAAQL